jgi:L,D-transpeptidase YcbB
MEDEFQLARLLRERLAPILSGNPVFCSREMLCGSEVLPRFYGRREYTPAWFSGGRHLSGPAEELIRAVAAAEKQGLKSENYHTPEIRALLQRMRERRSAGEPLDPETAVDLELLLTDAFLLYASNLLSGLVNPETIEAEWFIKSRDADLADILKQALASNSITGSLAELQPRHEEYAGLVKALRLYQSHDDGEAWPTVPAGPSLEKGMRGPDVKALNARLRAAGDLKTGENRDESFFDPETEAAVLLFQKRHGLLVDGKVGRETRAAFEVSRAKRIEQIKANLERWRWLPHSFGEEYIRVNIADYGMIIVRNSDVIFDSRVVVGKYNRKTPVFSGLLTYLEINPFWNIPRVIAVEDLLPKIREDSNYFLDRGIRVFESWADDASELDAGSLDWADIGRDEFPYRLRQDPGPLNSLGRIKFMFPNRFAVYLHDTPARELFSRSLRGFSSGCIRVEKPVALALELLRDEPLWTEERILETIESLERTIVRLPRPVPVFLIYLTAWADESGTIHFREDIYRRDGPLHRALSEMPPGR